MTSIVKPKQPRVSWSHEEWLILEAIVDNTKTQKGVPMATLLENKTPKNNQILSM